ncbi:hypothetical protein V8C86DRAFT_2586610 [Haematococcus lacustris]
MPPMPNSRTPSTPRLLPPPTSSPPPSPSSVTRPPLMFLPTPPEEAPPPPSPLPSPPPLPPHQPPPSPPASPSPPSPGDAPQQQSSINTLTAQLNLTLTPQLAQVLQAVSITSNGSQPGSTASSTPSDQVSGGQRVLSVRSRVTVQLPAGVFSEASSSDLQAASQLLNLQVTQRLLALPLAIPPGSEGLAAGVCSAALANSIEGDEATATKLQLISVVAAAAGVPSSWVSVACLPAPDASQPQSRRLATATRPGHPELPAQPWPAGQALRQLQASTGACSSSSPSLVTSITTQGSRGGPAASLASTMVGAVSAWQAAPTPGPGSVACPPSLQDVVLSTSADVVLTVVGGAEALAANAPLLCQGITDLAAQAATALMASGTTAQASSSGGGCSLSSSSTGTATSLGDGTGGGVEGQPPSQVGSPPPSVLTAAKILISVMALGGVAMFATITLLVTRSSQSWSDGTTGRHKLHAKMADIMRDVSRRQSIDPRRTARILMLLGVQPAPSPKPPPPAVDTQAVATARAPLPQGSIDCLGSGLGDSILELPATAGMCRLPPTPFLLHPLQLDSAPGLSPTSSTASTLCMHQAEQHLAADLDQQDTRPPSQPSCLPLNGPAPCSPTGTPRPVSLTSSGSQRVFRLGSTCALPRDGRYSPAAVVPVDPQTFSTCWQPPPPPPSAHTAPSITSLPVTCFTLEDSRKLAWSQASGSEREEAVDSNDRRHTTGGAMLSTKLSQAEKDQVSGLHLLLARLRLQRMELEQQQQQQQLRQDMVVPFCSASHSSRGLPVESSAAEAGKVSRQSAPGGRVSGALAAIAAASSASSAGLSPRRVNCAGALAGWQSRSRGRRSNLGGRAPANLLAEGQPSQGGDSTSPAYVKVETVPWRPSRHRHSSDSCYPAHEVI